MKELAVQCRQAEIAKDGDQLQADAVAINEWPATVALKECATWRDWRKEWTDSGVRNRCRTALLEEKVKIAVGRENMGEQGFCSCLNL
jgi:hypothetical protein